MCITIEDLEARLPAGETLTADQRKQGEQLIASATVLAAAIHKRQFGIVADDIAKLRAYGSRVVLPKRPVSLVASVSVLGAKQGDLTALAEGDQWRFDGIDTLSVAFPDRVYEVTYSHGSPAPPELQEVVASAALRVLMSPTKAEGVVSDVVGQVSVQYQQGSGSNGISPRFTAAEKDILRSLRTKSATIRVRS